MMKKELIEKYLLQDNLSSYDPYDIWKTYLGKKVKKFYYKNRYLGIAPAGVLTIFDLYINNYFRVGYNKQEYPIVRGQASLALLNLYQEEKKESYLIYAKKHIDWLLSNSSQGYSGRCWGLNFDWVYSAEENYDKNTPFSTHTPYPLEAMVLYYKITKDESLLEPIETLFLFVEEDIKVMIENDNRLILSYGVQKDRIVTNANSYLMYMYALLIEFLPQREEYIKNKIYKIYNFICSVQQNDGSWLYSPYDKDTFIDCFHTAFVLKNIIKTDEIIKLHGSNRVVQSGYRHLLDNFFDKKKSLFKRFSKSNKISITKFDLYDNAEVLNLAIMLEDSQMVEKLSESIKDNFIKNGDIASMIDIFGSLKNFNHNRWAITPYLYTLSKLREI